MGAFFNAVLSKLNYIPTRKQAEKLRREWNERYMDSSQTTEGSTPVKTRREDPPDSVSAKELKGTGVQKRTRRTRKGKLVKARGNKRGRGAGSRKASGVAIRAEGQGAGSPEGNSETNETEGRGEILNTGGAS